MTIQSQAFIDFINTKVKIKKETKEAIIAVCTIEELKKGHLLLKEGRIAPRLYFIIRGSARTFYYHEGKDITSWIYREKQLVTSWGSYYSRSPAHENMELIEDSSVCSILFEDLQKLYVQYPKIQEFGRIIAEEQIIFLDFFYKGFFFITAKEKYELLLSTFPDVTQRVNLGYIASYLGISQETLSRIRKKK